MEKGKWHKVNGRLVRKRQRRAVINSDPDNADGYIAHESEVDNSGDTLTDTHLLDLLWQRMTVAERIRAVRSLEEEE